MTELFEPRQVTAGDRIQWRREFVAYPATAWVLSYALVSASGKISITGTSDGTTHVIDVPAATSGAWAAGRYKYQAYVTKGSERVTVASGEMTVLENFATATSHDTRSIARQTLDAIEATIQGRATKDQQSYEIMGRKLQLTPITDLIVLRDKYSRLVKQEENAERVANGFPSRNKLLVRF